MRIELLCIEGCPNTDETGRRVDAALSALGHGDVTVHRRMLGSPADIAGTAFAGSPTITFDGADIFPADTSCSGVACRVYRTPAGLAGLPAGDQILGALRARFAERASGT